MNIYQIIIHILTIVKNIVSSLFKIKTNEFQDNGDLNVKLLTADKYVLTDVNDIVIVL